MTSCAWWFLLRGVLRAIGDAMKYCNVGDIMLMMTSFLGCWGHCQCHRVGGTMCGASGAFGWALYTFSTMWKNVEMLVTSCTWQHHVWDVKRFWQRHYHGDAM